MPEDALNATSPLIGGNAPPSAEKSACHSLDEANQRERKHVVDRIEKRRAQGKKLSDNAKKQLHNAKNGGMTVSSALFKFSGASGTYTGISDGRAHGRSSCGGLVGGGPADILHGKDPVFCGEEYKHASARQGGHAEAKIANNLTGKLKASGKEIRDGTITLNINWLFDLEGQTYESGMPCPVCYSMLCHAAKECNVKIFICDRNNKPQPFPEDCNEEGSREKLSKLVDGDTVAARDYADPALAEEVKTILENKVAKAAS